MPGANYRTILREDGAFVVEVTRPGNPLQMTVEFATEAEADAWIEQDKRLSRAADPFSTPAGNKWRGF